MVWHKGLAENKIFYLVFLFGLFVLGSEVLGTDFLLGNDKINLGTTCPYRLSGQIDYARCTLYLLNQGGLAIPYDVDYTMSVPEGVTSTALDSDGTIIVYVTSRRANTESLQAKLAAIDYKNGFRIEVGGYPVRANAGIAREILTKILGLPYCDNIQACGTPANCDQQVPCTCAGVKSKDICSGSTPLYEGSQLSLEGAYGTHGAPVVYSGSIQIPSIPFSGSNEFSLLSAQGGVFSAQGGVTAGHVLGKEGATVKAKVGGTCSAIGTAKYVDETLDAGLWEATDASYIAASLSENFVRASEASGDAFKGGATTGATCGQVTDPRTCIVTALGTEECGFVRTNIPACPGDSGSQYFDMSSPDGNSVIFGILTQILLAERTDSSGNPCVAVVGSQGPDIIEVQSRVPIDFSLKS